MYEASPLLVVPVYHRLLDQGHIRVPMARKLHRTVYSQMIMFRFQVLVVTFMRITTELSELVVVSLVL